MTLDNSIFTSARFRAQYGHILHTAIKKIALKNFVAKLLLQKIFSMKYF
jgi:hypothetical protein